MDPVQRAKQIVFGYNENPKEYTDTQAEQIAMIAAQLGLPFRPESKALQKFFFDLADNLAFGALPNEMRPTSRGESVFGETKKERAAGALSLLGLALPGAVGASVARTGAKALAKRLPQKTQDALKRINTNRSLEFAVSGAGGLGAVDILEDPAGTPDRALAGALLGGGLGLAGGMLGRSGGGGQGMSRLLMSGNRGLPAAEQRMLLGSGARRLSGRLGLPGNPPGTLRLGPSSLLNNTDDYLRTAINQAFIR
jgi:hypothetical protein